MAGSNYQAGLGMDGTAPESWHVWFEDFDNFEADQWVATAVGAGTSVIENARGGILALTNAAADDDSRFLQWSGDDAVGVIETFRFDPTKRMRFGARFKVNDATQSDFVMGLQITDTTPLDVTDGIYFQKDDGDAFLDFHVEKDNVRSSVLATHTMVDDTYVVVEWLYDGNRHFTVLVNGLQVGGIASIATAPDDEDLTISFGVQNGAGAAKSMRVDWIKVSEER